MLENLIKYGIRVDPIQWFVVMTGRDEGADYHSLVLLICKFCDNDNNQFLSSYYCI